MRLTRVWFAVFVLVVVPAQFAVGMRASRTASVTGDEPFYLLTAQSLVSDGDLDLRDEYAAPQREMRRFWDGTIPLWKQMEPAPDGRLLAPHDPGLSLLITPAYWLGGLRAVQRFLVVLWAAAMATAAVLAARRKAMSAVIAGVAVGAGAPGIVYASQVYPEGAAALCVALGLSIVAGARARPIALSVVLTALAWLGVKYAPIGVVLAGVWAWRRRGDRRALALVAGIGAVAAAHYVWWHVDTFGGLTPYSTNVVWAGEGDASIVGDHFDLEGRFYRLHGLFLDSRFGLFRWCPIAVLALWGMRRRTLVQAGVIGICMLLATFASITIMGWWFPGRMLVAAFPALVVLVAVASRRFPRIALVLGGWSVLIGGFVAWRAHNRRVRLAVDPFDLGFPLAPHWWFPDFREFALAEVLVTSVWFAVLGGLLWATRWRPSSFSTGTPSPTEPSSPSPPTWRPPAGR